MNKIDFPSNNSPNIDNLKTKSSLINVDFTHQNFKLTTKEIYSPENLLKQKNIKILGANINQNTLNLNLHNENSSNCKQSNRNQQLTKILNERQLDYFENPELQARNKSNLMLQQNRISSEQMTQIENENYNELNTNNFVRKPMPINRISNIPLNSQSHIKLIPTEIFYKYPSNMTLEILLQKEREEEKKKTHKCNCKKSRCLKLYCECFANGEYCIGCSCQDCSNIVQNEKEKLEAFNYVKDKNPVAMKLINKVIKNSNSGNIKDANNFCPKNSYLDQISQKENSLMNLNENEENSGMNNLIKQAYSKNEVEKLDENMNNLNAKSLSNIYKNETFNKNNINNKSGLVSKSLNEESDVYSYNNNSGLANDKPNSFKTSINYGNKSNISNQKNSQNNISKLNNYIPNNEKFNNNNISNTNNTNLVSEQIIGCNCTKSNCTKKYCECFKAGKTCIEACRCRDCDNIDGIHKELKNKRKYKHGNPYHLSIYDDFVIEKISIHIEKSNIFIKESVVWDMRDLNTKINNNLIENNMYNNLDLNSYHSSSDKNKHHLNNQIEEEVDIPAYKTSSFSNKLKNDLNCNNEACARRSNIMVKENKKPLIEKFKNKSEDDEYSKDIIKNNINKRLNIECFDKNPKIFMDNNSKKCVDINMIENLKYEKQSQIKEDYLPKSKIQLKNMEEYNILNFKRISNEVDLSDISFNNSIKDNAYNLKCESSSEKGYYSSNESFNSNKTINENNNISAKRIKVSKKVLFKPHDLEDDLCLHSSLEKYNKSLFNPKNINENEKNNPINKGYKNFVTKNTIETVSSFHNSIKYDITKEDLIYGLGNNINNNLNIGLMSKTSNNFENSNTELNNSNENYPNLLEKEGIQKEHYLISKKRTREPSN